jgi:hypothetical protein
VTPAKAIADFIEVVTRLPIEVNPDYFNEDIEHLRSIFSDDEDFVKALAAVRHEFVMAVRDPNAYGIELDHQYRGWRRSKFQSQKKSGHKADLRLVYRPLPDGGLAVLVFGHRYIPDSVYFRRSPKSR